MDGLRPGTDFETQSKTPKAAAMRAWLFVAGFLGVVFVGCSIFYIWLYVKQVQNGYYLSKLVEEYEQLDSVQRKLRLEWSRLQDPFLLEEMGRKQFGLAPPRADKKILMH